MDKSKMFQCLFEAFVLAYPTKHKRICQEELVQKWNGIKHDADLQVKVDHWLQELKAISASKKGSLLSFWAKQTPNADKKTSLQVLHVEETKDSVLQFDRQVTSAPAYDSAPTTSKPTASRHATAQQHLQSAIDIINSDLVGLYERQKRGMLTQEQYVELKEKKKKKNELENQLKKKKDDQKRSQKARDEKKRKFNALCEDNPELLKSLKVRAKPGRPRIEEDQPSLLKTIVNIAMHGSASHERRQSDVYRSIKTLDQLTEQLKLDGFIISRSGLYLRLLPRRSSSLEGQRHVSTVPVKLIRAQNDHHAKHIDGLFATATIKHLEELASILGPNEVCFISQDDKARVPIGLTAANKQSPLLMHVEYRVHLPDHDWVVAAGHKLIPSVYAGIQIQSNGLGIREAVGYSGPTYIAIRSGKHSSSTSFSHGLDFERLLSLKEFDVITRSGIDGQVKPILVLTVDGGPDENPRYQKVIKVAVHHFLQHHFDAVFIATNAPGRSAFNRVERKMAPLSNELTGLILPHDHYGNHLNERGVSIDADLEKKNFKFAGITLAEIWSQLIVDTFSTVAEFIDPTESELLENQLLFKDHKWYDIHVRTSQYFTQIVKCTDNKCCSKPRSSYFSVVTERFLPPPLPVVQTSEGLKMPERTIDGASHNFPSLFAAQSLKVDDILPRSSNTYMSIPYDLYCPSVQSMLSDRICKKCHMYFASLVMLRSHSLTHKQESIIPAKRIRPQRIAARRQRELMVIIANEENGESADWIDEDELDLNGISIPQDEEIHALPIYSMEDHFASPWENGDA
ncbi:hypothetical protein BsWGS_24979 [Bradybaena similaris]